MSATQIGSINVSQCIYGGTMNLKKLLVNKGIFKSESGITFTITGSDKYGTLKDGVYTPTKIHDNKVRYSKSASNKTYAGTITIHVKEPLFYYFNNNDQYKVKIKDLTNLDDNNNKISWSVTEASKQRIDTKLLDKGYIKATERGNVYLTIKEKGKKNPKVEKLCLRFRAWMAQGGYHVQTTPSETNRRKVVSCKDMSSHAYTKKGFQRAIEIGAWGLEANVFMTSDSVPVVTKYGYFINKDNNKKVYIKDMTYAEVAKANPKVMKLEDFSDICVNKTTKKAVPITLRLDVNSVSNLENAANADALVKVVSKLGEKVPQCIIASTNPTNVKAQNTIVDAYNAINAASYNNKVQGRFFFLTRTFMDPISGTSTVKLSSDLSSERARAQSEYDRRMKFIQDNGTTVSDPQTGFRAGDRQDYLVASSIRSASTPFDRTASPYIFKGVILNPTQVGAQGATVKHGSDPATNTRKINCDAIVTAPIIDLSANANDNANANANANNTANTSNQAQSGDAANNTAASNTGNTENTAQQGDGEGPTAETQTK